MKDSKAGLADLRGLRAAARQAEEARLAEEKRRAEQARLAGQKRRSARTRPAAQAAAPAAGDAAPSLDPADRALFRQAVRFVQPLPDRGPRARALPHRDPESLLLARREHAQGGSGTAAPPQPARPRRRAARPFDPEDREFLQPGCGPDLLRGLKRGKWIPQATLDLHGSTQDEARDRLDRFLGSCLEHEIRCVRIVHGKGIGSRQGEPVLKLAVRQHLCRLEWVQAWIEGAERDGGAGAVTALLRLPAQDPALRPDRSFP
jgi:DNA-nicking Smr family endonuclease